MKCYGQEYECPYISFTESYYAYYVYDVGEWGIKITYGAYTELHEFCA